MDAARESGREGPEALLRRGAELWNSFVEHAPLIVLVADRKARIQYANRNLTSLSDEALIGRPLRDFVDPEDHEVVRRTVERCLATGEPGRYETRAGGSVEEATWYETHVGPIRNGSEVIGALLVLADISERKRAEAARRESEGKLGAMLAAVPDYMSMIDREFTMRWANDAVLAAFGDDVVGRKCFDVFHGRTEPCDSATCSALDVFENDGTHTHETEVTDKQGRVRAFQATFSVALRDESGRPSAVMEVARDVTEERAALEQLRDRENFLRSVLDSTQDAIIAIGEDGLITTFNPAAERLFGRESEEMIGRTLDALMPEEFRARHAVDLKSYFATGAPHHAIGRVVELPGRRPDGTVVPMEISLSPGTHQGRKYVIGVARDVSGRKEEEEERRTLEEKMQRAQKLESLGVLAGGIAHDFNNLLLAILGNADLALLDLPSVSPVRRSVEEIRTASLRAADLAQQMLAYSGKGAFTRERFDLSALVNQMTQMLEVSPAKTARVQRHLAVGLPPIEGDPAQLRQLVMNLSLNASEALPEGKGKISISTGVTDVDRDTLAGTFLGDDLEPGRYVSLEILDEGCGMDADTQARVFDPFFTTKFAGRGLGMAAVLGIIRGHGGTISMVSEPGAGTTVRVLFPAAEGTIAGEERPAPRAVAWIGTKTVLVVDDEAPVRKIGERMLSRLGVTVLTAENGLQAVEIFREHADAIDCVLLDLTMPYMSGAEAFRELRRIRSEVRVILSSGYDEQEVTRQFSEEDRIGFIQKPYELKDLERKLGEAWRDG